MRHDIPVISSQIRKPVWLWLGLKEMTLSLLYFKKINVGTFLWFPDVWVGKKMQCLCSHQEHWHSLSFQWTNGCKKSWTMFFCLQQLFTNVLSVVYKRYFVEGRKCLELSTFWVFNENLPKVIMQKTIGASPMEDSDMMEQGIKKNPKYQGQSHLVYFSYTCLFYLWLAEDCPLESVCIAR